MTPEFTFTVPSAHVAAARDALARLERHLGRVIGPLDATTDFSALLLACMELEGVNPPYPPIDPHDPDPHDVVSFDPREDLATAIEALMAASKEADTARETLRFAYVVHALRELVDSPYLDAVATDTGERA